jgi:hypothetical protein
MTSRLALLKQSIERGEYRIDPEAIAEAMIGRGEAVLDGDRREWNGGIDKDAFRHRMEHARALSRRAAA